MADSSVLGRFLWYELLTTDMKAAEQFYGAVVGWTVAPFDGSPRALRHVDPPRRCPDGRRHDPPRGHERAAALGDVCRRRRSSTTAVAEIERLGGSAMSPVIDVPTVGRMRTMKDPQGAMFSVYEPISPPQRPRQSRKLGDVSWHELYTTDADAAMTFYTTLFGWKPTETMDMGEMGKYQMFGRAFPLGGMMKTPPEMAGAPPDWSIYFRVDDVHAGAERVKANGGQVLNGPMEVPGGDWIVNCMDPQGAAFSLHHRK